MTRKKLNIDDANLLQNQQETTYQMPNAESRWFSRRLVSTPVFSQKKRIINNQIISQSSLRKYCFKIKRKMIMQPLYDHMITLCAGFIINLHLMITIVIIFEKVKIIQFNIQFLVRSKYSLIFKKHHSTDFFIVLDFICLHCITNYADDWYYWQRMFLLASRFGWTFGRKDNIFNMFSIYLHISL